jgi:hypothetical protein
VEFSESPKEGFSKYGIEHVGKNNIVVITNTRQILKDIYLPRIIEAVRIQFQDKTMCKIRYLKPLNLKKGMDLLLIVIAGQPVYTLVAGFKARFRI